MSEQIQGKMITEITAVSCQDGKLICFRMKNPQAGEEHNFFLQPDLCGKLYPLIPQVLTLAKRDREKAGNPDGLDSAELRAPQDFALSDAEVMRTGDEYQMILELGTLTLMMVRLSAEQAGKLAAALQSPKPAKRAGKDN